MDESADDRPNDTSSQQAPADFFISDGKSDQAGDQERNKGKKAKSQAKSSVVIFILHRLIKAALLAFLSLFGHRHYPSGKAGSYVRKLVTA